MAKSAVCDVCDVCKQLVNVKLPEGKGKTQLPFAHFSSNELPKQSPLPWCSLLILSKMVKSINGKVFAA